MTGNCHLQAQAFDLVHSAAIAIKGLQANVTATPIGMLNFERLEMTPAGIERGELLATICLAPMEQTSVTQKEWSVIDQEYTSIVTDFLENYSQTGRHRCDGAGPIDEFAKPAQQSIEHHRIGFR